MPFTVTLRAAAVYYQEFVPTTSPAALSLTAEDVFPATPSASALGGAAVHNKGTLSYLQTAIATASGQEKFHLDKVAFARATVEVLTGLASSTLAEADVNQARQNFSTLLAQLALHQRKAERAESVDKISSRINRAKRDFNRTHPDQARKEDVVTLTEEISSQLDNSPEAEQVRATMRGWHLTFELDNNPRSLVPDYPALLHAVDGLAYRALRVAGDSSSSTGASISHPAAKVE